MLRFHWNGLTTNRSAHMQKTFAGIIEGGRQDRRHRPDRRRAAIAPGADHPRGGYLPDGHYFPEVGAHAWVVREVKNFVCDRGAPVLSNADRDPTLDSGPAGHCDRLTKSGNGGPLCRQWGSKGPSRAGMERRDALTAMGAAATSLPSCQLAAAQGPCNRSGSGAPPRAPRRPWIRTCCIPEGRPRKLTRVSDPSGFPATHHPRRRQEPGGQRVGLPP